MYYDIPLKQLFHGLPHQLLYLLTGSRAVDSLNVEYPDVKARRPDLVTRLEDGRIFHLELQSTSDPRMSWRMLEYYALIWEKYGHALQQVLYVGAGEAAFITEIHTDTLYFKYALTDIRDLDCRPLLDSNSLEDNILAVLCRLHDETAVLRRILEKIAALEENARQDALNLLLRLSGLRALQPVLNREIEAMSIQISLENDLFMREAFLKGRLEGRQEGRQEGRKEGRREGQAQLFLEMLEERFGPQPEWLNNCIRRAGSVQLRNWLKRLPGAANVEAVFDDTAAPANQ